MSKYSPETQSEQIPVIVQVLQPTLHGISQVTASDVQVPQIVLSHYLQTYLSLNKNQVHKSNNHH